MLQLCITYILIARYYNMYCFVFVAVAISFDPLTYFVNENNQTVELLAILSNPSIADITVQIMSSDVTAISKYSRSGCRTSLHMYICIYYITYVHTRMHTHTHHTHTHTHTHTHAHTHTVY